MSSVPERIPRTDTYIFDEAGEDNLEFRLIYKGRLPAEGSNSSRAREKHAIRKYFHRQLAELWQQHPLLRREVEVPVYITPPNQVSIPGPGMPQLLSRTSKDAANSMGLRPWIEHVANQFSRNGYRFAPLVRKDNAVTCSLDILFLRRDNPGNLIRSGGDIDNRIKVLMDGLKMPGSLAEIGGYDPEDNENPFYCLLEDDSLITGLNVTTDRLLLPRNDSESLHDVYLVIRVITKVTNPEAFLADSHL